MLGRILSRLRRYLITGLIVVAPVGVTAFVLVWLFQQLDSILGRYLRALGGYQFPGLGILVLFVLLVFVGWMLRWAMGRKLVGWWNRILSTLPLTRRIYNATSQIAQTVLARQERLFQSCALIEYPDQGSYTLAFVTARAPDEVRETLGEDAVTVFLPTTPNPTTGYLILLPAERVRVLDMSVEDGIKMVLSAGTVTPGGDDERPLRGLDLDRLAGGGLPGLGGGTVPFPPGATPAGGKEDAGERPGSGERGEPDRDALERGGGDAVPGADAGDGDEGEEDRE